MEGFFTKKETESKTRPDGRVLSCFSCGRYKDCSNPKLKPYGRAKAGIFNIATAPTRSEDRKGKPWSDFKLYSHIKDRYASIGINLYEDCLNGYATACNDETENPTTFQIDSCRNILLKSIESSKPKLVVLFGEAALYSLINPRWGESVGKISKWQSTAIPDLELGCWIYITQDAAIERNDTIELVLDRDFMNIKQLLNTSLPNYTPPVIEYIEDLSVLKSIDTKLIAFDYETTGLKPHARGHRIVCASVATSENHVYAFMMPDTEKERKPFVDILANPKIGKMAHNMKFEEAWSVVQLKQPVQNWVWDSMLAAHLLDNRRGITGLKFQTFINFGIGDYSSEIKPYLQPKVKGGNEINTIDELIMTDSGKVKLLEYCALDSIYQYRLAMIQQKRIKNEGK